MRINKIIHALLPFFIAILLAVPAQAVTIIDQSGRQIEFSKPFNRIISLYPAHTENLYSLGLDKQIIGASKDDDYPPQVQNKAKFHYRDDPEKFIAARPDLVLIRPMIARGYPALVKKLSLAGITVVSLQPTTIAGTFEYWRKLGQLTGRAPAAEEMIKKFKDGLTSIHHLVENIPEMERKTVYFESIHRRMKTFAPDSMAIFCLASAGGLDAAPDAKSVRRTNIAAYGKEHILARADKIDVFLAQTGRMNRITTNEIYEEPGFQTIKAVRDKQVYLIKEELVSRPTMRLLQGIRQIGRLLYPRTFGKR